MLKTEEKRIDVMVDIETLGTKTDSTVFQVSAIAFDLVTGEHYPNYFNLIADIEKNKTLNVDGSTLKWWLNTDKELLTRILNAGSYSSKDILISFHSWLSSLPYKVNKTLENDNLYLWGNGILFDNKMIQHQFQSIGLEYPIYYKNDRDVRTILEIASLKTGLTEKEIKDKFQDESLVKHNAIDDVKAQIKLVVGCYDLIIN